MAVAISLIIPTYNRAGLLTETLDHALNQTVPFAEIIVVDDGSTDHTVEALEPYMDRIKLIRGVNGGVQIARNRGVAAASSEYIALCDSDDLLESGFVETMGNWLDAHRDMDAAYTNLRKFRGDEVEPDHLSQAADGFMKNAILTDGFYHDIPDLYLRLFTIHYFCLTGCTLKKAFYEGIGSFNPMFKGVGAEDGEFTLRAAAAGRIAFCTAPLARVRRHDGNDSADSLYMSIGSAQILEYACQHHRNIQQFVPALRDRISQLRLDAASDAFAKAEFNIAKGMFVYPPQRPMGLKFHVKKAITHLPAPLRHLAWKLTQAR